MLTHFVTVRDAARLGGGPGQIKVANGWMRDPDGHLIEVGQTTGLLDDL